MQRSSDGRSSNAATTNVAAVVVAAGCSRRMGRPKLLMPWRGGRTIIDDVVTRARAAASHVVVVTGQDATATADAIAHHQDIQLIHNADYAAGEMISSVKAGVAALPPACAAFFLVLGDQPGIAAGTFARLVDAWRANPTTRIISPTWNNRRGHPVLFSAAAAGVAEILALPSDATLKTYVTRHAQHAIEVEVDDPTVCIDVDTPEQYTRLVGEAATATAGAAASGSEIGSPSCPTNATTATVAPAAD